jgi:hypothetical protein
MRYFESVDSQIEQLVTSDAAVFATAVVLQPNTFKSASFTHDAIEVRRQLLRQEFSAFGAAGLSLVQCFGNHDIANHLAAIKGPHLNALVRCILFETKVCEADVEREFSKLKRTIPSGRTNIDEEHAAASLIVNSVVAWREHSRTTIAIDAVENVDEEDEEEEEEEQVGENKYDKFAEFLYFAAEEMSKLPKESAELDALIMPSETFRKTQLLTCWGSNCTVPRKLLAAHAIAQHGEKFTCTQVLCGRSLFAACHNIRSSTKKDGWKCPKCTAARDAASASLSSAAML